MQGTVLPVKPNRPQRHNSKGCQVPWPLRLPSSSSTPYCLAFCHIWQLNWSFLYQQQRAQISPDAPPSTSFRLSRTQFSLFSQPTFLREVQNPIPAPVTKLGSQLEAEGWCQAEPWRLLYLYNREFWFLWKQCFQQWHCWLTFSFTCCKSWFFFASLLHESKWLFLFAFNESHPFFFNRRLFICCAIQCIYNPSQLHFICRLSKHQPDHYENKILNRSVVRADLFQAAPKTLPLAFLKIKLVCNRSTLLSSQVGIQHPPAVPQQDTKNKLCNCSLSFICKGYYSTVETIRLAWQKAVKLSYDNSKWVVKLCWKFRRDK